LSDLLTARAVAERLGVSAETVLRWTREGKLPGVRLPGTVRGRLRYRPEDIDTWLADHATLTNNRQAVLRSIHDK
jgi:excisionase family DNA binding protein